MFSKAVDNPLAQWGILVLAVAAGILALKAGASLLPAAGPTGAVKSVVASI